MVEHVDQGGDRAKELAAQLSTSSTASRWASEKPAVEQEAEGPVSVNTELESRSVVQRVSAIEEEHKVYPVFAVLLKKYSQVIILPVWPTPPEVLVDCVSMLTLENVDAVQVGVLSGTAAVVRTTSGTHMAVDPERVIKV